MNMVVSVKIEFWHLYGVGTYICIWKSFVDRALDTTYVRLSYDQIIVLR